MCLWVIWVIVISFGFGRAFEITGCVGGNKLVLAIGFSVYSFLPGVRRRVYSCGV